MNRATITTMWDWLWEKHDQAKEMFTQFSRPTETLKKHLSQQTTSPTSKEGRNDQEPRQYRPSQSFGLFFGPILFVLTLMFFTPEGLPAGARGVLATTLWMAVWWITEAIPIPATSLLPIILFPLTGALELGATTAAYGSDTIFLFMGGFMIALAMEKWNLHKRIALSIIYVCGTSTDRIVFGFIIATGFISMWISNTATSMMMVPIGMAIIYQVSESLKDDQTIDTRPGHFAFGKALMLGIAYSASIGGLGTLVGTPPNALLAGVVEKLYGIQISFAQWFIFGAPVAVVFLIMTWFYLVKIAYPLKLKELPGGRKLIESEMKKLGPASFEEKAVLTIFVLTAAAWMSRSFLLSRWIPGIDDTIIAMAAAIVLFIIPSLNKKGDFLLDWETAKNLPWGILLLFGGGLAIAAAFVESGLSQWIGEQLTVLEGLPVYIVILTVVAITIFLTEFTSNTATSSMLYPIMAALALAIGVHPYALFVATSVAASYAFMMPVGTPPNAVVFGSGYLRIPDMIKTGFWLNVLVVALVPLIVYFFLPLLWGIDLGVVPQKFQ